MDESTLRNTSQWIEHLYHTESRRVLATLIRLLGDFDLAEEALHDAFAAAVEQWTRDGIPKNPRAWLVSTGRFKGRSTAPDLYLLPSRIVSQYTGCPDPARNLWTQDRGNCQCIREHTTHDRPADCARQSENSGCENSLRSARDCRSPRSIRCRPGKHLTL